MTDREVVLADLRSLLSAAMAATGQYGRTRGPVVPEMENLNRIVSAAARVPEYLPTTWCYPDVGHHVSPHRGCILR